MKHFIHLNDFSKQEIIQIFELADKLKADNGECDWLKQRAKRSHLLKCRRKKHRMRKHKQRNH